MSAAHKDTKGRTGDAQNAYKNGRCYPAILFPHRVYPA
jgi:hypothetical protein